MNLFSGKITAVIENKIQMDDVLIKSPHHTCEIIFRVIYYSLFYCSKLLVDLDTPHSYTPGWLRFQGYI